MVAVSGRGWRLAPSLVAMVEEADRIAPRRSKISDGSIGDRAHRNRTSDHNPSGGIVHAADLTHSPATGFDAHAHVRNLAARRDPRVKYLISNRRIWTAEGGWRRYSGANPHTAHAHVSVKATAVGRYDTSPWFKASVPFPTPPIKPQPQPQLEEDVGQFIQGKPSGRIVHLYGERYRHLTPTMWARRRFFGAEVDDSVSDADLDNVLSDLLKDPT